MIISKPLGLIAGLSSICQSKLKRNYLEIRLRQAQYYIQVFPPSADTFVKTRASLPSPLLSSSGFAFIFSSAEKTLSYFSSTLNLKVAGLILFVEASSVASVM